MPKYKYRKSFTIGYRDGKPIRKDIKSNNRRDFLAKCKKYEQLIDAGVNAVENQQTVEQWAWTWY